MLKVKVLKHKTQPDTFGMISYLSNVIVSVYPTSIPEVFPTTASINSLKELYMGKKGEWEGQMDQYEMVDATLEIVP